MALSHRNIHGIVIGPDATDEQLSALRQDLTLHPRGWIAQELVALSTAPTWVDNRIAPRHLDLRPFAINDGNDIWVLPGGLTRVALPEGGLVVNSSQGGGSKDTWVIAGKGRRKARVQIHLPERSRASEERASVSPRKWSSGVPAGTFDPEPGPSWDDPDRLRQQERQQQQVRHGRGQLGC